MEPSVVKHQLTEQQSRFMSGSKRKKLGMEMINTSCTPSRKYMEGFLKLQQGHIESGTRMGTPEVMRKISSEAKMSIVPHHDVITSVCMLRKQFITDGHPLGYIQKVSAHPFSVTLYTELGIRLFHNLTPYSTLFCDATGSIVSNQMNSQLYDTKKRILYYALVLGSTCSNTPPVAVAELITTDHSVPATCISQFIQFFRYSEGLLYGLSNVRIPIHLVIDRSLVLLLSFLREFNFETISGYFNRCFRMVTGCSEKTDTA